MREEVLAPAGMTETYIGVDPETQAELGRRLALNYKRSEGGRLEPDGSLNDAEAVAAVDPGGNVRGPVGALGRFYIAMLDHGAVPDGERRLVDAETAERMLDRQRVGMSDRTFGATIDWGLGFMLNSRHHGGDYPYDFGPHASRDAFGHGGRQCANAFADPEHRLVVAWVANGLPGEPRHQQRNHAINAAIYEDLGLA
jgi:CubicO group peptidase (beta-lactamase class C family)